MNKRSAMLMAAGLVAALAVGAAATSFSLGGSSASAEGSRVKPIVKTVRDTVTIHKKAKGSNDGPTVVTLQGSSDDATDDFEEALEEAMEQADDDESGDDDHEDEDHEHEDEHEEDDD